MWLVERHCVRPIPDRRQRNLALGLNAFTGMYGTPMRPIIKIITLYEPEPSKWIDFKVRR